MPYFPPASGQTSTVTTTVANKKVNTRTGASYTLAAEDASALVTLSNESGVALTIPTNQTVAFPVGTVVELLQLGPGLVTVLGLGVTIGSKGDQKSLKGQYSQATLIKTEANSWVLTGDLAV